MTTNPPNLRPDLAPSPRLSDMPRKGQPTIGMVSLGCPKALVDSERILTRLRAEGYGISPDYSGADAVIVNTCGFLDSAKAESLEAIGEALTENGRVIVTGCLGAEPDYIRQHHPRILAVTGPHQYEQVLDAVHHAVPPSPDPFVDLLPAQNVSLTPRHYSYLKISEGCNHKCRFCIIPDMRGRLQSRPHHAVMREAERLVAAGVKELLVISQDTSAYGTERGAPHPPLRASSASEDARKGARAAPILELARDIGTLGAWVRLHYVYPYPHVRDLIPLMADPASGVLPYLDIPFQHAHPGVLRRMARPAASARTLDEIANWRAICPDITLRSTFIVGYPGETEAEFQTLLDWLDEARLDRVGCFQYENVAGARSNDLPDHVAAEVKQDRWDRFMAKAQAISEARLSRKVGQRLDVIVDEVDSDAATCRTKSDAPEIDGNLFIDENFDDLTPGDIVTVEVDEAGEYDLWGAADALMRLVVHAGTHKTATTAFQHICHRNRAALKAAGICYPEWGKRKNHGFLALSLRQGDHAYVEKLFADALRHCGPDDTMLISGEGLERCFVDVKMAFDLEDIARRAGIGDIEWVVVERDPFDYFQSLYGELSKQYLAMNYIEMAETILKHGFLSAACKYYDYMFVFDHRKFFGAFPSYRGSKLRVLPFEGFTRPYPGHAILEDILSRPGIGDSLAIPDAETSNARLSSRDIEFRYVCNFLGLSPGEPLEADTRALADALIARRLGQISQLEKSIASRFGKRFGAPRWKRLLSRRESSLD